MKTLILEQDILYQRAAEEIRAVLEVKPEAVIAMSAGRTMLPLWEQLDEGILERARLFQVAEFCGAPEEKTLRHMTETKLLPRTGLKPENCFWLTEETLSACDEAIEAAGGLDLAVLGIGDNAHIGLNEPATQFSTRSRTQKLTEKTRAQYSWLFGEEAPEKGLTLGIRTLTEARKILVLATGEEKAQAVFDMLYARDDSIIPAAFLQIPAEVSVFADPEAGKKL